MADDPNAIQPSFTLPGTNAGKPIEGNKPFLDPTNGNWWIPAEKRWATGPEDLARAQKDYDDVTSKYGVRREVDPAADAARYGDMSKPAWANGPTIDQTRSDESRKMQLGSLGILGNAAGPGMSQAGQVGAEAARDAQNAGYSLAGSVRGGPGMRAAATRNAQQNAGQNMARAQVGIAGANAAAQQAARGQYATAAQGLRTQDLGVATDQAKLEAGQRSANEQQDEFYQGLRFDQKKSTVDDALGRSDAAANAANAARQASLAEQKASQARTDQAASAVTGTLLGAVEGASKKPKDPPDPYATSDERAKTDIVPLYEVPGTERHYDRDVSKAKAPDMVSGASLSGPTPRYGSSAPAAPKAAKGASKTRRYTNAELAMMGNEMAAAHATQHAAQLGAGPATQKAIDRSTDDADPKDVETIRGNGAPVYGAADRRKLHRAMEEGGEGASPYAPPPKGPTGVGGAPKGYYKSRSGEAGDVMGWGTKPTYDLGTGYSVDATSDPWKSSIAPGTKDDFGAAHKPDEYSRQIMTSDVHAKRQAFIDGINHADKMLNDPEHATPPEYAVGNKPSVVKQQPAAKDARAASTTVAKQDGAHQRDVVRASSQDTARAAVMTNPAMPLPVQMGGELMKADVEGRSLGIRQNAAIRRPVSFARGASTVDTALTPDEEASYQEWKKKAAPNDSGADYDLRGAYKAGVTPDPQTAHWPDTYKKPNHETFSDESQYAKQGNPGHWEGETYIPPAKPTALSDKNAKTAAHAEGDGPMASSNRAMAPSVYEYKPGFAEEAHQQEGEKNVGPMAQNMAADPIAATAIVKRPDGMLAIDKDKGLKLALGGLASLQGQVDSMKKKVSR